MSFSENAQKVSAGPDAARVKGRDIADGIIGEEEGTPLLLIMGVHLANDRLG